MTAPKWLQQLNSNLVNTTPKSAERIELKFCGCFLGCLVIFSVGWVGGVIGRVLGFGHGGPGSIPG